MGDFPLFWTRILPVMAGVSCAAVLGAICASPAVADGGPTGSAFAVSANVTLLGSVPVGVSTAEATYPAGSSQSVVHLDALDKGEVVSAHALNASAQLRGNGLVAKGSIADVRALNGALQVKLLEAVCTADSSGVRGDSNIVDLRFGGKVVKVSGDHPVNLDALGNEVPGGIVSIRANEQVRGGGSLTVNALHVRVGGALGGIASADIILGQAKCAGGTTTTVRPTPTPTATATSHPTATPSATPSVTATSTQNLAYTGASVVGALLAGIVLIGAGVGALFFMRRRRSSH